MAIDLRQLQNMQDTTRKYEKEALRNEEVGEKFMITVGYITLAGVLICLVFFGIYRLYNWHRHQRVFCEQLNDIQMKQQGINPLTPRESSAKMHIELTADYVSRVPYNNGDPFEGDKCEFVKSKEYRFGVKSVSL